MSFADIFGTPFGARHIAITAVAALASGIAVGFAVDRIFSEREERRGLEEGPEWEPADGDVLVNLGEYSDYSVPEAFEKPDISHMTDYTKYFDGKEASGDISEPPKESPIEIITEEEFLRSTGNEDGYASVVGTWFPGDGVLAGWNNELSKKDISKTIGNEAVELLREEDAKAVYVRNKAEKVLYEVVKGVGSLSSEIHPENDLE